MIHTLKMMLEKVAMLESQVTGLKKKLRAFERPLIDAESGEVVEMILPDAKRVGLGDVDRIEASSSSSSSPPSIGLSVLVATNDEKVEVKQELKRVQESQEMLNMMVGPLEQLVSGGGGVQGWRPTRSEGGITDLLHSPALGSQASDSRHPTDSAGGRVPQKEEAREGRRRAVVLLGRRERRPPGRCPVECSGEQGDDSS